MKGEQLEAPGMVALIAALISILLKEILYQYTVIKGKNLNSQAVVANAWHHRSDAFSSIGTAIGIGGAILLGEHWRVLDPIAAVIVSFFIMKVGIVLTSCLKSLCRMKWRKILSKHCSLFPELVSRIISVRGVSVVIVRLRYMCAWMEGLRGRSSYYGYGY